MTQIKRQTFLSYYTSYYLDGESSILPLYTPYARVQHLATLCFCLISRGSGRPKREREHTRERLTASFGINQSEPARRARAYIYEPHVRGNSRSLTAPAPITRERLSHTRARARIVCSEHVNRFLSAVLRY